MIGPMREKKYFEYAQPTSILKYILWDEIICILKNKFNINPNSTLEIGSGRCEFINSIDSRIRYAVDLEPEVHSWAEGGVNVLNLDLNEHNISLNLKFDLIFSSNTLEHMNLDAIIRVIRSFESLLNENGKLVLIGPNFKFSYKNYFDDPTHLTPLTDNGLKLICARFGLSPVEINPRFLPYTMNPDLGSPRFLEKWPKLSRILLKLYLKSPYKPFAKQFLLVFEKLDLNREVN